MSDTATISFRTDPAIKREARELYADMGMVCRRRSTSFCASQSVKTACLSRSTRDNPSSIEARRQTETHDGESFTSTDALMKDLLDA